jgi:membrane associated rhomboid family serine protease
MVMGIHDRDYYQEEGPSGFTMTGGPRLIVTNLVIITVAIALIDIFTPVSDDQRGRWLSNLLALKADIYRRPWEIWNLLSYGFAHTPIDKSGGIWHVGLNMFMLWMFGRVIELRLGRLEFLWFYLAAIVFSGLAWLGIENAWLWGTQAGRTWAADGYDPMVFGASGGVTAVFLLFVLYYPRQTVYVWGLLAVPAWVIGAIVIGMDLLNAATGKSGNVAWQAHVGGAAFAFLYVQFSWHLSRRVSARGAWQWPWKWLGRGSRLRIHHPDTDDGALDEEADRILEKVHREGEQSLSGRERRILEKYSRRMRERRRP